MLRFVLGCLLLCALIRSGQAAKPKFTPLIGHFPTDISADGKVVVGNDSTTAPSAHRAFRWTEESGVVELEPLRNRQHAVATSADGSVVIGADVSGTNKFLWTLESGTVAIGDLSGDFYDLSDDGRTALGNSSDIQPFLWTEDDRRQFLRPLEVFEPRIAAFAMTGDATTIVGQIKASEAFMDFEPMRWTAGDGFRALGTPDGETRGFSAIDVSADGKTLLVRKGNRTEQLGFLWNSSDGYHELDAAANLFPQAMSDDAMIVVGDTINFFPGAVGAFIWDSQHGTRSLQDVLVTEYGLGSQLEGWFLNSATDISADGRTIAGAGRTPSGQQSGWVVIVPEPSGALLAMIGLVGGGVAIAIRRRTSQATA